jgi:hypothetical protein
VAQSLSLSLCFSYKTASVFDLASTQKTL